MKKKIIFGKKSSIFSRNINFNKKIGLKYFFGYKFGENFISNRFSNTKILTLTQKDKIFSKIEFLLILLSFFD